MKALVNFARSLQSPTRASALLISLLVSTQSAQAMPSFARQTGQDCAACHIGSHGPQLTPYGMKFKMEGYTDSDGKEGHIPLSAMLVGSWAHTNKSQSAPAGQFHGTNDNLSLQEAALFVAGRLSEHVGAFVQTTYTDVTRTWAMDNMDLRYAHTIKIDAVDTILGLSLNNSPTVQDPFNNLPVWRFPFVSTEIVPLPMAAPLMDGALAQRTYGLTAYTFWNESIYAELGAYGQPSRSFLGKLNNDPARLMQGLSPYWRLSYFKKSSKQSYSVGIVGMNNIRLRDIGTSGASDQYDDYGIDASYQYLGNRKHVLGVNAAYMHEKQNLDASFVNGASSNKHNSLDQFNLIGSYYYDKTYGLTAKYFNVSGTQDALLHAPAVDFGSANGKPNSSGLTLQADWSPFGKEDSWGAPWANVRLGLAYTMYQKFNGASRNYDGNGRNASDNNSLYAFLWTAF